MNKNLNLKKWKKYKNIITTDSLWISNIKKDDSKFIIPKRKILSKIKNDNTFHGVFIPEIPYQFIKRFTKKNDIIWDCFAGSGTTKRVADVLGRLTINTDLNSKKNYIIKADARYYNPNILINHKIDLIIMHPPYFNIVKYSNDKNDGSNQETLKGFLIWFEEVCKNVTKYLKEEGFLILICGNIYLDQEEKTLGVWCKDIICKYNFKCKAQIIKDYGETKGGNRNYNLNYYRQLNGNYNNFYGDNIFILQKGN